MTGQVSREQIIKSCIQGIINAQKAYESWSGEWLWSAPEYLSTVFVAKEIAKGNGSEYITLEHSASAAIEDAGARGRGRLHSDIRANGRFDILLWWANGKPRAPIEVKCQVTKMDKIRADIKRISKVVHRKKDNSTINFGAMVFYTSFRGDNLFSAKDKLLKSLELIRADVLNDIGNFCLVDLEHSRIYESGDSAWAGVVIVLRPQAVGLSTVR